MELDFGITEYYKRRYGTEKEIDDFCAAICIIAKRKVYSSKIDRIDFLPFILPEELIQQGMGPVFTKIELRYRLVTITRQINFEAYQKSDLQGKKTLLMDCLIGALREIRKKIGFDIDTFENDLKSALGNFQ
ncbi:MAG: hypothetical protein PHP22_08230 [Oscillospiraceae bacterium]|nr:hypothetical protein [Oscillospiraceae bacterium]